MKMEDSEQELNLDTYYTVMYSKAPLRVKKAVAMILLELTHAEHKFPEPWAINKKSKLYDHCYAAAIVSEESGELTRAAMQHEHEGFERGQEMLEEACQVGATTIRFIMNTLDHQGDAK